MSDSKDQLFSRQNFLALGGGAVLSLAACSGGGSSPGNGGSGGGGGGGTATPHPTATPPVLPYGTTDITVRRGVMMGAVPANFVSLSYEKSKVTSGFFVSGNTALTGCFTLLGKGVLRVGGISVDQTTWTPNGAGATSGQVAPADIDAFAAFIKTTGWTVMYGVNLASNTPAAAAAEAAYAAQALGTSLYSFEIGNEADLYSTNGIRPKTYTVGEYETEWSSYASAILNSVPGAVFAGPESAASYYDWSIPFAQNVGSKLSVLTQHYSLGDGEASTATMAFLLTADSSLPGELSALQSAAKSDGDTRGFRITEANSFYNGGAPGVSNAFGSALWATDFLLLAATYGAAGVHFNSGDNGPGYTPIGDSNNQVVDIRPEYYGALLVSQIATGPMYAVAIDTGLNLTSYAVAGSDGATYLVIINKDGSTTANTTISLGATANSYTLLSLSGSGLSSLTGTTLGNALVSTSGTWTPATATPVTVGSSTITIQVPAATAALLKIV